MGIHEIGTVITIIFLNVWHINQGDTEWLSNSTEEKNTKVISSLVYSQSFSSHHFLTYRNELLQLVRQCLLTIIMSLKRKRSVLSIKDKNEEVDDAVFQTICKSVVSRLNVVFLI